METSGKRGLGVDTGQVQFGPRGGGRWLLDPTDLTVDSAGANNAIGGLNGFNPSGVAEPFNIRPAALQAANTNITLQATNSVKIQTDLTLNGTNTLRVETNAASGLIELNANVSTGGAVTVRNLGAKIGRAHV